MPGQKKLGLLMGKSMVSLADGSQGLPEGSLTSPPAGQGPGPGVVDPGPPSWRSGLGATRILLPFSQLRRFMNGGGELLRARIQTIVARMPI